MATGAAQLPLTRRFKPIGLAATLAILAPCALPALAADGYRAALIADPLTGLGLPGLGWSLGGNTSLNNSGTVVYSGYASSVTNGLSTAILANTAGTTQVIASGLQAGTTGDSVGWAAAINNAGQVLYGYNRQGVFGGASLLWDKGSVTTYAAYRDGNTFNAPGLAQLGLFSDAGTVVTNYSTQLQVIGPGGTLQRIVQSGAFSVNAQGISADGRHIIGLGNDYGADPKTALVLGGRGDVVVGRQADGATPRPTAARINNNGLGVFTSYRPGSNPGSNLIGVIDANAPQSAVRTLLDAGDGFTQFGASQAGLAINNRNEIAFAAAPVGSPFGQHNVYLTTSAGGAPRLVLAQGDVVDGNGTTFVDVLSSNINSFQLNDRGQISLFARLQRGNQTFEGILRLDPEAGASAGNPLLPAAGAPEAPPPATPPGLPQPVLVRPGWGLIVPAGGFRNRTWLDPEYATGYVYSTGSGGPNFETILVPSPLPGGDASFSLHFAGQSFALQAGQIFNFTDHVAGGVSQFTLLGIDLAEKMDPKDSQGFVAGFTFTGGDGQAFSVQMNPLVAAVPEPAAGWMLLAGVGALATRRHRIRGLVPDAG